MVDPCKVLASLVCLHGEYQDNQGYVERSHLKTTKTKEKKIQTIFVMYQNIRELNAIRHNRLQ